jgi:hypothetical protein
VVGMPRCPRTSHRAIVAAGPSWFNRQVLLLLLLLSSAFCCGDGPGLAHPHGPPPDRLGAAQHRCCRLSHCSIVAALPRRPTLLVLTCLLRLHVLRLQALLAISSLTSHTPTSSPVGSSAASLHMLLRLSSTSLVHRFAPSTSLLLAPLLTSET